MTSHRLDLLAGLSIPKISRISSMNSRNVSEINVILSYKSYFIFQELYQVELHPHPLHFLAKDFQTPVNPIGYPHFLAPKSTSMTTPHKPIIYVKKELHSLLWGCIFWYKPPVAILTNDQTLLVLLIIFLIRKVQTTNTLFSRNTIRTGIIWFINCKQLISKMFPCFHTLLNPIISIHTLCNLSWFNT